jgi:hypothetical protein
MKSPLTLLLLVLLSLNILAGCAAGPNQTVAGLYCAVRVCGLVV